MPQEDTTLQNVWICPKCFEHNGKSTLTCNCGLPINEDDLSEYRGTITSHDLFKLIHNYSFIGAERKEFILSYYLLKRFPTSHEAQKLEQTIDATSQEITAKYFRFLDSYIQKTEITCGKCGTTNVYNKQTQKCSTCGDWLFQYMVAAKEAIREEDKAVKAVNDYDRDAIHCPNCRSTQITAQKQGFGLGKAVVGTVITGGVGLLGGFIRSRKIYLTCLKCGHRFKPNS